jgi:GDPmannose 4,6-dehydratase
MWQMLQQDRPDDYVIATGQGRSVREFLELAFSHVGLDYRDWVKFDPKLTRPADVVALLGDASKAQRILGWEHRISFKDLVVEMVETDLELLKEKVRMDTHQLGARHALAAGTVGAER